MIIIGTSDVQHFWENNIDLNFLKSSKVKHENNTKRPDKLETLESFYSCYLERKFKSQRSSSSDKKWE